MRIAQYHLETTDNGTTVNITPIISIKEGKILLSAVFRQLKALHYHPMWMNDNTGLLYFVEEINEGGLEISHTMEIGIMTRWV